MYMQNIYNIIFLCAVHADVIIQQLDIVQNITVLLQEVKDVGDCFVGIDATRE